MPSQKKATTRRTAVRRKPFHPRPSAFSADFLDRARRREAEPDRRATVGACLADTETAHRAPWAGPWEVEPVPTAARVLHVVGRRAEAVSEGAGARLAFLRRQDALFGAAACSVHAVPNHLTLNTDKPTGRRSRFGHPIHDGPRHLGHMTRAEPGFLTSFHALRTLAADPDAAALFIEALDPETLALLGRAIMRRLS